MNHRLLYNMDVSVRNDADPFMSSAASILFYVVIMSSFLLLLPSFFFLAVTGPLGIYDNFNVRLNLLPSPRFVLSSSSSSSPRWWSRCQTSGVGLNLVRYRLLLARVVFVTDGCILSRPRPRLRLFLRRLYRRLSRRCRESLDAG